mmetsp:Transcript_8583/g.17383  ORF Transcript_8583/g.17383 Transcript_8583/m.17383 type:complete len:332 (-) Transcript_8583:662-1657(-)
MWTLLFFSGAVACCGETRSPRLWTQLESALVMTLALALIVQPELVLAFQVTLHPVDALSALVSRCVGCLAACLAFLTRSPLSVMESEMLNRSFLSGGLLLLLSIAYAKEHYSEWNSLHWYLGFSLSGAITSVHLARFLRIPPAIPEPEKRIDIFLQLDFLVSLSLGLCWYSFPHWVLGLQGGQEFNGIAVHMGRVFGAGLLALSLMSLGLTSCPKIPAKRKFFQSRAVSVALMIVILVVSTATRRVIAPFYTVAAISVLVVWTANSLLGLYGLNIMNRKFQRDIDGATGQGHKLKVRHRKDRIETEFLTPYDVASVVADALGARMQTPVSP